MRGLCSAALAAVLVGAGSGCGGLPKPVRVEGRVTLDGQPLAGATVTFTPVGTEGQPASGRTAEDGTFRLNSPNGEGAMPGDYKIVVTRSEAISFEGGQPPTDPKDINKLMMGKMERGRGRPSPKQSPIPPMYTDVNKTPLRQRVPPDGKVLVELQSKQ